LLSCDAYQNLRKKYLGHVWAKSPKGNICTFVLKDENVRSIRSLAMYIFYALRRRTLKLEDECTDVNTEMSPGQGL